LPESCMTTSIALQCSRWFSIASGKILMARCLKVGRRS